MSDDDDGDSTKNTNNKNKTGMSDQLRKGLEALSGYDLDHVRVHTTAKTDAIAYDQGNRLFLPQSSSLMNSELLVNIANAQPEPLL